MTDLKEVKFCVFILAIPVLSLFISNLLNTGKCNSTGVGHTNCPKVIASDP